MKQSSRHWMPAFIVCPGLWIGGLALVIGSVPLRADEYLFGFVRSAETLPRGGNELYQFMTLRTGKVEGTYYGTDFETEIEHGFTDRLQADLALENHYFYNQGVNGPRDSLEDTDAYRFGGVEGAIKYRVFSPFKDALGLTLRLESGYLLNDEVDGLRQHEFYLAPELILQKNFRDDTLIWDLDLGPEWAWGKRPAELYPRELALNGATGVSYRIAPNWFLGVESHVRAEYPLFDFNNFEHVVLYAGPALHYSSRRWWATLTWNYQVYGQGIGEPRDGQTFAEETRQLVRLIIGFNF
jgi:hypothetical protein